VKEEILITGYNGSLAKQLSTTIDHSKYRIKYLTTQKSACKDNIFYWDISTNYINPQALANTHHIIHISGFSISNKWNAKNKKLMYDSRVKTSLLLYNRCIKMRINPKTFISISAMGYYGFKQNGLKTENDKPHDDWLSKLCVDWEKMADNFKKTGTRVCILRSSLIINKNAEIIQKTNIGFNIGLGLIFGSGQQQFPWIHIKDMSRFIVFIIENKNIQGVFNVASPEKISYQDFIKKIKLIKYPNSILLHVPEILLKLFIPKKKELILNNIKLCVKKMKSTGFFWEYETIERFVKNDL
tara:strand:+ start:1939 stop:2835 length:897 start_codon:yes stop_codon:yes gene_type:complete